MGIISLLTTIIGKDRRGVLLTMVEHKTLYTMTVLLKGRHAGELAQAAIKVMLQFKDRVKTITLDNDLIFSKHKEIGGTLES